MFFQRSRRDVLRLLFGGGLLGVCRALFGVQPPALAATPTPTSPALGSPLLACGVEPLGSCTTYTYDAAGTLIGARYRDTRGLITTFVYDVPEPGSRPGDSLPPAPGEEAGGDATA